MDPSKLPYYKPRVYPRKDPNEPIKRRVSAKVRTAIQLMTREGLKRAEAAQQAGLQDNSLYVAMRQPEVKALYHAELGALREAEKAKTFHTLLELRDDAANGMVRLGACKELISQELGPTGRPPGVPLAPGVIINIIGSRDEQLKTVVDTGPTKPIDQFKDQLEPPADDGYEPPPDAA